MTPTGSRKEFINSPQEVTVREKLNYEFDVSQWTNGDPITAVTARLMREADGEEIISVVTNVSASDADTVTLTVDWRAAAIRKRVTYRLWVTATINNQIKEGFADFKAFYQ